MDLILTYTDARRAYRIARGEDAPFTLKPLDTRGTSSEDNCDARTLADALPILGNLGIYIPNIPLAVRTITRSQRPQSKYFRAHSTSVPLPSDSFWELVPKDASMGYELLTSGVRILVDCPELCTVTFAREETLAATKRSGLKHIQAYARTFAFAAELCGTYALDSDNPGRGDTQFDEIEPVMTTQSLSEYLEKLQGVNGVALARSVSTALADDLGSPMEALLYALLTFPVHLGGLALDKPSTNEPLDLSGRKAEMVSHLRITPDLYWRLYKLVVEYDGKDHFTADAVKEDKRRIVDYQALGFVVLPLTNENMKDVEAACSFIRIIVRQMAKFKGYALVRRTRRLMLDADHRERMSALLKAAKPIR